MSFSEHRLWHLTIPPPPATDRPATACKNALAPFIEDLRVAARQAGWEAQEIGLALLSVTADQLKDPGYGEPIN
jgi:hypothetical protein